MSTTDSRSTKGQKRRRRLTLTFGFSENDPCEMAFHDFYLSLPPGGFQRAEFLRRVTLHGFNALYRTNEASVRSASDKPISGQRRT